jgi:hypothetical protein
MQTPVNRHERRRARALARSLPPPPPSPIERWARASKSKHPDREVAVLERVLQRVRGQESFRAGNWISHATLELYARPVSGFGPVRRFSLLTRFVDFLRAEGDLDAWSHAHLTHLLLCQQVSERVIEGPRPITGLDEHVRASELPALAARFAETLTHPVDRQLGAGAVTLGAWAVALQQRSNGVAYDTRFGALDVQRFVDDFVHIHEDDDEGDEPGATPALFRILADFYAWRGAEGRLDPARADEIARALRAAALAHGALRFAG